MLCSTKQKLGKGRIKKRKASNDWIPNLWEWNIVRALNNLQNADDPFWNFFFFFFFLSSFVHLSVYIDFADRAAYFFHLLQHVFFASLDKCNFLLTKYLCSFHHFHSKRSVHTEFERNHLDLNLLYRFFFFWAEKHLALIVMQFFFYTSGSMNYHRSEDRIKWHSMVYDMAFSMEIQLKTTKIKTKTET